MIDFGCEYGIECIEIAKHGAAKVIGLDIRENVLAVATDLAREAGTYVEFTTSTAEKADIILSLDSFEHYSNPAEVLRTMASSLKPSGRVLVSFGPTWFHPLGGHAFTIFPWSHVLFTERAQMRWRNKFVLDSREHKTRFVDIGEPLNGMTIGKFKRVVADSPLKFDSLDLVPIKALRLFHNRITQEFVTSVVASVRSMHLAVVPDRTLRRTRTRSTRISAERFHRQCDAVNCACGVGCEIRDRTREIGGVHPREGSADGMSWRLRAVSMMLGNTQLTLMPRPFSSSARLSVKRITTAFDAQYAPMRPTPLSPARAPTLTILPPPAASIAGTAARTMFSIVFTFRSNMNCHVASVVSWTASPIVNPPATFASTSMRPNFAVTSATMRCAVCASVRSPTNDACGGCNRDDVDERELCAAVGELVGDRRAERTRGAGDDDDFAVEVAHSTRLLRVPRAPASADRRTRRSD